MEILELNANNVSNKIWQIIQEQKECVVWGIPDKHYIFTGYQNNNINSDYAKKYNAQILNFPNDGGAIVTSAGDFDLGYFSKDIDNKFNEQLSKSLAEYLTEHGVNTQIIDNDLIIDGMYKCGSFSSRRFGDLIYSAFHVSINVDLQMIRDICVKKMSLSKIPKGLSEYGITTEKIKSFVEDFIKKYE